MIVRDGNYHEVDENGLLAQDASHTQWYCLKRWFRFRWQKFRWGFDERELWNLNSAISRFALPRLKRFKTMERTGYPAGLDSMDAWNDIIDDMIYAFEVEVDSDTELDETARYYRGHAHFRKYWLGLWD